MKDRLTRAFSQVRASEKLKDKTRAYILHKIQQDKPKPAAKYRFLAAALACMVLLVLGGHRLYFTPTVAISIDINPSIELGVNRFNRVISSTGYNEDGQGLLDALDLTFRDYSDAVNQIIESEAVSALLSEDELLSIAVIGAETAQSKQILSDLQSCTAERSNTYCYYAHSDEVQQAHEVGLSYGKYRAFLDLQAVQPDATAEQVQGMTMREIRDRIAEAGGAPPNGNGNGQGGNGSGSGSGNGQSSGNNSGNGNGNGSGSGNSSGNGNGNGGNGQGGNGNGQGGGKQWGKTKP